MKATWCESSRTCSIWRPPICRRRATLRRESASLERAGISKFNLFIATMLTELLVLRIIHILGGIFWLGSGLFTAFFLTPALGRVGPAAVGPVMSALQQRRLFTILPIVAVLTILSGVRLL